ncbi:MAG: recombinase family protein, partial [Ruminococcus sp.]|nr:recombinase family protein [Ruminococcus sp.]
MIQTVTPIFPALNLTDEPVPALQKIRVACYIRVSTDNPEQEDSYEVQERYFSKLLLFRPDWDSVGVYTDYGISGTKKDNRNGLNRLLRHCEQGRIDRVICKSISRLSRNTADTVEIIRKLKTLGITCYFEKEDLDTGDMQSEFILTTLA